MVFVFQILIALAISTAHAAHDPSTCVKFLSADLSATLQLENQIKDKTRQRTSRVNDSVPTLVRDDGAAPTLLIPGIKKLFSRDVMLLDVAAARSQITLLANAWTNSQRTSMTKNVDSKLRGQAIENMRLAIISIRDRYNQIVSEQSRTLSEKIYDEYSAGKRAEPNFQEMRDFLFDLYHKMLLELMQVHPLEPSKQNKHLEEKFAQPNFFKEAITQNAEGYYQFEIRQSQGVGVYDPRIGTLVLQLNEKTERAMESGQAFAALYLHGCGTNRSNVASWATLFPMLAQNGSYPFAYNMPGAVGECGIGMNSLRSSQEVGLYLNNLAEHARETMAKTHRLPIVTVGRSAGSTQGLMSSLMNYMVKYNTAHQGADLYFLTSFSDPRTIEQQDLNLKNQIDRGEIKGIVLDALTHFNDASDNFQHHLQKLKDTQPQQLAQFGDDVVFVQGEADQDGQFHDGSGRTVFQNLREYRDLYAPYAHIYEIEDPLKEYRKRGLLDSFSYDSLEATHFLYSNRPNITEETRGSFPKEIPEADLPKLRDQSYEVFALKFAMMDYLIDFSTEMTSAKRTQLKDARLKLTGENTQFGYLSWYVKEKLDAKVSGIDNLTLQKIISDPHIQADRQSGVPGRVKKVYNYILNEAKRMQVLKKQHESAAA